MLMLVTNGLQAQNNYYFDRFTMADGLSSNQIKSCFADSRGFLWVCTANGLNRYDGYTFKKYFNNPDDPSSLPSNFIQNVCEDKSGKLWIAMYNGLATYDYRKDCFKTLHPAFEKGYDKIESVFCDSRSRIWLGTNLGHYLLDTTGRIVKHWKNSEGLIGDATSATFEDKEGRIWVTGGEGVFRYNETTRTFTAFQVNQPPYMTNNFYKNNCISIGAEDETGFYIGSWGNGLRLLDKKSGEFNSYLPFPNAKDLSSSNSVFTAALFNNQVWVASDFGLATFNRETHRFAFINDLNLSEFPAPTGAAGLYVHNAVLWITSGIGLYKLDLRKQLFTPHKINSIEENSPCLEGFNDIAPLKNYPDSLIVSTWTCGAFGYNIKTRTLKKLKDPAIDNHNDIYPLEFNRFIFDRKGNRWAACSHGIYHTDVTGKSLFIKPFPQLVGLADENYINDISEDSSGNIWALSNNGIYLFRNGNLNYDRILTRNDQSHKNEAFGAWLSVCVSPIGDVYLLQRTNTSGRKAGITVFKNNNKTFYHYKSGEGIFKNCPYPNSAYGIYCDKKENIWLCSGKGLFVFNINKPEKFKRYNSAHGLISDNCLRLVFDLKGNVWTSAQDGVSYIDVSSGKVSNYYCSDILPEAHAAALAVDSKGLIYIGFSGEWLFVYDPAKIYASTSLKEVKITRIRVNDKDLTVSRSLSLPYDFANLNITFSAMNFLSPDDNLYRITISSGSQKAAVNETSLNELNFASLPPGKHFIKIESLKDSNSRPVIFTVDVSPAIWQTIWFRVIVGCLVLLLIIIIVRNRINILRKRELQRTEFQKKIAGAEMAALRSQMNPHFIFNALNGIHSLIWEQDFTEASEYLTKFSRLTRKVLENSRSQLISLADDLEVLHYFIQLETLNFEFGLNYNISIASDLDTEITRIPPLILQPFVENAIKHGLKALDKKGNLLIEIKRVGDELVCIVEDNGIGRIAGAKLPGHTSLGTTITEERIQVFNALYNSNAKYYFEDLLTVEGKAAGTKVYIHLPYMT